MTSNGIPDDCDCLLINAPTSDYSAEEADTVINYLDNGGNAIIIAGYTDESMENFSRILAAYGMELADGIVMESSSNYYQYPMYIIPILKIQRSLQIGGGKYEYSDPSGETGNRKYGKR